MQTTDKQEVSVVTNDNEVPPMRDNRHEALTIFLGRWRAEGQSYGGTKQTSDNPRGAAEPWVSTHNGTWHTGEFFLIQDERAMTGANPFDTLSVMGVDAKTGRYFARSFENHGFYRHYDVDVDGQVWMLTGETERARIEFSADGRTQTIAWEWRPYDQWLPLCDRVAQRED
jgi:hypothetical protein